MATEIKRAYTGSDDNMFETSSTLHNIFNSNLADFTLFDTTLDAAYSANWLLKINNASTVVRDSQIKDIQAQKTIVVIDLMRQCRLKYDEVKYFAKRAFPDNKAKQAEFGTDTYKDIRNSHSKMISFLAEMHKACIKYQAELIAKGMTLVKIAEIETLRDQLMADNTDQESFIKGRPVLTQDRIITLNECYYDTIRVIEAAQIVYANDYARKNQYVFNPNASDTPDSVILDFALDGPAPIVIYDAPYDPSRLYTITNNGPGIVSFHISNDPNNSTLAFLALPGSVSVLRADQMGIEGNFLFAKVMPGEFMNATIVVEINIE